MTLGTLRDQVIYPDGKEDQKKKGISDQVRGVYILHSPSPTQILCHFKRQIVWPNLKPSKLLSQLSRQWQEESCFA